MSGRFTSKAVANWLLDRFAAEGRPCTQLQMNKLVYIAHGWHLAIAPAGEGLIAEPILAWKYGPIVPSLRDEFREFGAQPITRRATEWTGFQGPYFPSLQELDPEEWEERLLAWAYDRYGHLSGGELIELTHQSGSPWAQITNNGTSIGHNKVIPTDLIREHYLGLLERVIKQAH